MAMDAETSQRFYDAQVKHKRTIRTFARNCVQQLPGYDIEDVEQELLVVLWRCVINYDPNKGASFNTLFQGSAKNHIISLIRHFETQKRKVYTVSLSDEAVAVVADSYLSQCSVEDELIARENVIAEVERRVKAGEVNRHLIPSARVRRTA